MSSFDQARRSRDIAIECIARLNAIAAAAMVVCPHGYFVELRSAIGQLMGAFVDLLGRVEASFPELKPTEQEWRRIAAVRGAGEAVEATRTGIEAEFTTVGDRIFELLGFAGGLLGEDHEIAQRRDELREVLIRWPPPTSVAEQRAASAKTHFERALEVTQRDLEGAPTDQRLLMKAGELSQKLGDNIRAAHYFDRLANEFARDGFFLKAVALSKQVLKLAPDLAGARERLLRMYGELGLETEAREIEQELRERAEAEKQRASRRAEALARQYGVPVVNLDQVKSEQEALALVPRDVALKHRILPLVLAGPSTLIVAFADPSDIAAVDDVRFITGRNVEPVVAEEDQLRDAIVRRYGATG